MSGPFAGMKYVADSVGSQYEPKLLGTYESELTGIVNDLCKQRFQTLVTSVPPRDTTQSVLHAPARSAGSSHLKPKKTGANS